MAWQQPGDERQGNCADRDLPRQQCQKAGAAVVERPPGLLGGQLQLQNDLGLIFQFLGNVTFYAILFTQFC